MANRRPWSWLTEPIVAQLTQGVTPEKIALSLAVGSLAAFFPVLGAATPLCFLAGILLGLNQPLIQAVNLATAPLYPAAVFGFVWVGERILGLRHPSLSFRLMAELARTDPAKLLHQFWALAGHALLGWAAVAPVWVGLGYVVLVPVGRLVLTRAQNALIHFPGIGAAIGSPSQSSQR